MNVYAAMTGYDIGIGDPFNSNGDPGIRNRIFLHDCVGGYHDFISDIRHDLHCDSDFSMKTIRSASEYYREKNSSNSYSFGVSGSAGIRICIQACSGVYIVSSQF